MSSGRGRAGGCPPSSETAHADITSDRSKEVLTPVSRQYVKTKERRQQIVDAALRLVSEYGVRGATLNRVAAEVGLTTPGLYAHFPSRRDLLLVAMDQVFDRVRELHREAAHPNALERLREIGEAHTRLVLGEDGFAPVLFEFIAAPPDEDLREVVGEKELVLVADLAEIVKEGQEQGSIRPDVDPYQIAWMLVGRAWTEDIASLMGIGQHWNSGRSAWMLDHILQLIAADGPYAKLATPPRSGGRA
jgi:AcrR family transcriptional regulator